MPRRIDREQRRRDILQAAYGLLVEGGMSGLTFRTIAERLGGSTTMVTHYFASQSELLDQLVLMMLDGWEQQLAELEVGTTNDVERLWVVLNWLVPRTTEGVQEERTRIILLRDGLLDAGTRLLFESWDAKIRQLLRERIRPLVMADAVELRVDMLRSVTNGLTLSIMEHPHAWDIPRIEAVLGCALRDMGSAAPHSQPAATPPGNDNA